jgi:phosphate transport system permease protein
MLADRVFRWVTAAMGLVIVGLLLGIAAQLALGSVPAWKAFGLSFLSMSDWDPTLAMYGALPFIGGTIVSSLLAMVIAVPVGVLTAVFLSEMAPRWLAVPLTFTVELIAAIPSVVIGLWGLSVLSIVLRDYLEIPFVDQFGNLPFFGAQASGSDLLAASLLLALMVTPTIVAITREVFAGVPHSQREALMGLGGTRWDAVRRVVIPAARSGIVGACVLALGRAMGETLAVTMTIGNADRLPTGLFEPGQTIASKLATTWNEASIGLETNSLVALSLVLAILTVAMILITRTLVRNKPASARRGVA